MKVDGKSVLVGKEVAVGGGKSVLVGIGVLVGGGGSVEVGSAIGDGCGSGVTSCEDTGPILKSKSRKRIML